MTRSYEVGYKKPPRDKQFKKGVSGNPTGRPRRCKTVNMMDAFGKILSKKTPVMEKGRQIQITLLEAFFRRVITDGINGKSQAARLIYNVIIESNKLQKEYGGRGVEAEQSARLIIDQILSNIDGKTTDIPDFKKTIEQEK